MYRLFIFFFVFILIILNACSPSQPRALISHSAPQFDNATTHVSPILKVMTLNLAHGRKESLNQVFLSTSTIKNNLTDIAKVFQQQKIDIIALQEADAPSLWSGDFNHVIWLSQQSNYLNYIQASHANSWLFSYGTGLLSRWPFTDSMQHTFTPSPPTLNKGFILGQFAWKFNTKQEAVLIDVISVHLDFSRESVRKQQLSEIKNVINARKLKGHNNPMIIMGDFNSDWFAEEKVIQAFTEKGNFHVYKPQAKNLGSYKSSHRLDWIIISKDLDFKSMKTLPDILSDHSAVVAEVVLK